MIGIVLAAGAGSRLHPLTLELPKTLLSVADDRTILDIALGNLAAAGIDEAVIVTGFAAKQIDDRLDALEKRHDIKLKTLFNDHALDRNNAYSLWLAREYFGEGVVLCNGDTVHPAEVEHQLLKLAGPEKLTIAVDDRKVLAEEEMKVIVGDDREMRRIHKGIPPGDAAAEYIGVSFFGSNVATDLAEALEATWRRDSSLYYEDGYQEYVDRGGRIDLMPIGAVSWVEVDNHDDLARAREVACRY